MKRKSIMILAGAAFICGLIAWFKADLNADAILAEHVTAFYRSKGVAPASKEQLATFEREMNLSPVSLSFNKLEFGGGNGIIGIASTRGLIFRSENHQTLLVGKKRPANQTSQAIGTAVPQPER